MKLFVDDWREVPKGWQGASNDREVVEELALGNKRFRVCWYRVSSAKEAIEILQTGRVTHISLDYDLGDPSRGTGLDILIWLEGVIKTDQIPVPEIYIHTTHPTGNGKMTAYVEKIRKLQGARLLHAAAADCQRQYPNRKYEDLVSYGREGLDDALRKFEPKYRVRFQTYAKDRIRGAILEKLRGL